MAKAKKLHERRKARVRTKIKSVSDRPRLSVFRSNNHIYAQIIDDSKGATLVVASTLDKELSGKLSKAGGNKEAAQQVGLLVAKKAKEAKIAEVVFDRGGYLYHGRIKALADGAREGGLKF